MMKMRAPHRISGVLAVLILIAGCVSEESSDAPGFDAKTSLLSTSSEVTSFDLAKDFDSEIGDFPSIPYIEPPDAANIYAIQITDHSAMVVGYSDAAISQAVIQIENTINGFSTLAVASADGSFHSEIDGGAGDVLKIRQSVDGVTSAPIREIVLRYWPGIDRSSRVSAVAENPFERGQWFVGTSGAGVLEYDPSAAV